MKVDVLPASLKDLETILQIQKDCYLSEAELHNDYTIPPLTQDMKSLEEDFNSKTILKAEFESEIIGSIRGFSDKDTGFIGKMAVKQEFQNKGIGQLLMNSI